MEIVAIYGLSPLICCYSPPPPFFHRYMCVRACRPSTTCSIDQSIGAALEYNLVFHKLFQKGIVHESAPPAEKWVPPANTHKLLAQSRAKEMLSE